MIDYCNICDEMRTDENLGLCQCGNNFCIDRACGDIENNECSICIDPVSCVGDEDNCN